MSRNVLRIEAISVIKVRIHHVTSGYAILLALHVREGLTNARVRNTAKTDRRMVGVQVGIWHS